MKTLSAEARARASMIGVAAIQAFYNSRKADLDSDAEFLETHFARVLKRSGYDNVVLKGRPKQLKSAVDKIRRKCVDETSNYASRLLDGEPPEKIMTDLVGIRVTCRFSDQIDEIEKIITDNSLPRAEDRIDYRHPTNYGNFGYAALHMVSEPLESSLTAIYFSGCAFEVQVRSILMDLWGVVNWDMAYTEEASLPYRLLRRMSTLSALMYLIDEEFIRIRDAAYPSSSTVNVNEPGTDSVDFSIEVAVALRKRGISFDKAALAEIAAAKPVAEDYLAKSVALQGNVGVDALSLYLFDKKKYGWLVDLNVINILDNIDRIRRV